MQANTALPHVFFFFFLPLHFCNFQSHSTFMSSGITKLSFVP
jgi:hypothetical protein